MSTLGAGGLWAAENPWRSYSVPGRGVLLGDVELDALAPALARPLDRARVSAEPRPRPRAVSLT